MKKMSKLIFFFFMGILLTGCAKVDDDIPEAGGNGACGPTTGTTTYSFSTDIQPIFNNNCTSCHSGASASASLDLSEGNSYCNLYKIASSGYSPIRVDPENSTGSVLYGKISDTGEWGGQMPPGIVLLSASDIGKIQTWIDEGAINN